MEDKKFSGTLRIINLLPQFIMLCLWLVQIFLTLDKEFLLSSAWPTPYKDAFSEDFVLYYTFYSIILLVICLLSVIRPRLTAVAIPVIFIFEIYTFISPILYKSIYYSHSQAIRYVKTIFNVTERFFYVHTLKSIVILAIVIMLFFGILSKNKKTVLILFFTSLTVVLAFILFEIINLTDATSLSAKYADLIPKSAAIGILRMINLLPGFFIGFTEKLTCK